jgi:hypothetical protein
MTFASFVVHYVLAPADGAGKKCNLALWHVVVADPLL